MYKISIYIIALGFPGLYWSGLINFLLGDTVLASWKQIYVAIVWLVAVCVGRDERAVRFLAIGIICTVMLVGYGALIVGTDPGFLIYNSFLYSSWIPLFVVLRAGFLNVLCAAWAWGWIPLIALSAVGLFLDATSDLFSFIERQGEGLSTSDLRNSGIAKRASLFFISSTMVIPIMAAAGLIVLAARNSFATRAFVSISIVVAGVCTGSLSSLILSLMISFGVFAAKRIDLMFVVQVSVVALVGFVGLFSLQSNSDIFVAAERALENLHSDSIANLERAELVNEAVLEIRAFSPIDHVFGLGLGSTNENKGYLAKYSHGESSYLQAYIEAGFLGLGFRLLPFLFLAYLLLRSRHADGFLVSTLWLVGSFAAVFTAPTFGNIPFQASLAVALALAERSERAQIEAFAQQRS